MRYEKEIHQYCKKLDKFLQCPRNSKRLFISKTKDELQRLVEEHSDVSFIQIVEWFGLPEKIAQDFLDCLETTTLARYTKRKNQTKRIYIVLAGLFFFIVLGMGIWYLNNAFSHHMTIIYKDTVVYRKDGTTEIYKGDSE